MFTLPDRFPSWLQIKTNLPVTDPSTDPVVDPPFPPPFYLCAGADGIEISSSPSTSTAAQWRLTPDGRILSGLLGGQLLAVASDGSLGLMVQTISISTSMLWTLIPTETNGVYLLQSQATGSYLVVNGGITPTQLQDGQSVGLGLGPVTDAFLWYFAPSNPLARVAAQYPTPFVPFVDQPESPQAAMYGAVSLLLSFGGTSDIRSQYSNVNVAISQPSAKPALPPGQTQAAWDAAWTVVSAQLTTEIGIRANVLTTYNSMYSQQQAIVGTSLLDQQNALSAAQIDVSNDETSLGAMLFDIFSTVVYTLLNMASGEDGLPVLAPVANVLNGAMTAASAGGMVTTDPLTTTIAALWSELSTASAAADTLLASAFRSALSDPAKSAAISADLYSLGGYTLYADPFTQNSTAVGDAWFVAVLQAVMGVKYRIYNPVPQSYTPPNDDVEPWQWIGARYIADGTDNTKGPSNQYLLQPLIARGVQMTDLASSQRGWNIPEAVNGPSANHYCVVRILNSTPYTLSVAVTGTADYSPMSSTRIDPYTSEAFLGQSGTGSFVVTDLDTGALAASFRCMWSYNIIAGQEPIVDSLECGDALPFGLVSPIIVTARDGGGSSFQCCSASAALTITYGSSSTLVLQYATADADGTFYAITAPALPGSAVTLEPVQPGSTSQEWVASAEGMLLCGRGDGTCLGYDPSVVDPVTGLPILQLMAVLPGPVSEQAFSLVPPSYVVATVTGAICQADVSGGLAPGCQVLMAAGPPDAMCTWTSTYSSS